MLTLALSSAEKGLIAELWEYFKDTYFSPEVPHLENIKVGSGSMLSLRLIIVGVAIGIIIASICTVYNKRYLGEFVRKLLREECLDKDSAKTLAELGYLKSPGVRGVIKTGGTLSRWVKCAEEDAFLEATENERKEFEVLHAGEADPPKFKQPEFKRDCNTMHFYIPKEKKYAADIKFDAHGANPGAILLICLGALILALLLCALLPDMIKLVDNFISVMK